jgi:hypothetical protein
MSQALDTAEAEARKVHEEWVAQSQRWAAIPGASLAMFAIDQHMIERMAAAFEVKRAPASPYMSACALAWTRSSLDATFGFHAWMLPWASQGLREQVLNRTTERFSEAMITAMRAKSPLS